MSEFKNNLYLHYLVNKNTYFGFILISLSFYIMSFILFRNSYDLPLDVLLVPVYVMFAPGILSYILFRRVPLQTYIILGKRDFWPLIIAILFPVLLSILFAFTYGLIRNNYGSYWEVWPFYYFFSFPLVFILLLIYLQRKYNKMSIIGGLFVIVVLVTYIPLLAYVSNLNQRYWDIIIYFLYAVNIVYLYIIPGISLFVIFKKVDA